MASNAVDVAQAGEVPQDAASQSFAGMQQGANLAMAYQNHQAAMEEHANKQKEFAQQQGQWAAGQLSSVLSIQNPTARAFKFKQFMKTAQVAGVDVDPSIEPLIRDDDFVRQGQKAMAQLNGLPYNDQTSAYMDIKNMLGDSAQLEKSVHGAGEITQQRYATNIGAQISGLNAQREMAYRSMQQASSDEEKITSQNKDSYDALRSANFVQQVLSDPKAGNVEINDAKGVLDKIINQGAVLRPQTMTMLGDSSNGLVDDARKLKNKLTGKGNITEDVRAQLQRIVHRFAVPMNTDLQEQRTEYIKSHPGVSDAYVFSKMPQYEMPGEKPTQTAQAPGGAPAGAQAAGGAPAPGQAPTAQAPATPLQTFQALPPAFKSQLDKVSSEIGIKLDPADPQFATKYAHVQQYIQNKAEHEQMKAAAGKMGASVGKFLGLGGGK